MARKGFLLIVVLAVLCVATLTVPASAAPSKHSAAAKSAQPPDVVQGNVYLITNSTSITALNATTGVLLWQFQPGGYIDPPNVVNNIVYTLVLNRGSLYALDESTGATLWTFHPSGFINTPVINGAVYITVDSSTSNSTTLYALNATTGATLWSFQPGTNLTYPVISQNIVYIGTFYSTSIYALSASKGKLLWHSQPNNAFSISLGPVVNGIIYGSTEGPKYSFGILYAFSTRDGPLLWSFEGSLWAEGNATTYVEGGTFADPLICALNNSDGSQIWCTAGYVVRLIGGLVYVTTSQSSFSVYKDSDGSLLWSNANAGFITVAMGVVYAAGNNIIEALKASNGSLLWRSQTANGAGMYVFVVNGLLTIASADNLSMYALKANSGALQWRYQLPSAIYSVSIGHGEVYVTTFDGTIYALKVSNGNLLWKH